MNTETFLMMLFHCHKETLPSIALKCLHLSHVKLVIKIMCTSNSEHTLLASVNPLILLATLKQMRNNTKSSNNQSVFFLSSLTLSFFSFLGMLIIIVKSNMKIFSYILALSCFTLALQALLCLSCL